MFRVIVVASLAWIGAAGLASGQPPAMPTKLVDLTRYAGRWYEIARVDNAFERATDCEAPTADYRESGEGAVSVVQTCHKGSPTGMVRTFRAAGRILDPGVNARLRLNFYLLASKEFWVLDHGEDYQWAILGDPDGEFVWLLDRSPDVEDAARTALVSRIGALGYDTSKLHFPSQK